MRMLILKAPAQMALRTAAESSNSSTLNPPNFKDQAPARAKHRLLYLGPTPKMSSKLYLRTFLLEALWAPTWPKYGKCHQLKMHQNCTRANAERVVTRMPNDN